jgi:hypothetical protein
MDLMFSKPQTIHKACHFQSTDHSQSLPFPKHRSFTKLAISKAQIIHKACGFQTKQQKLPYVSQTFFRIL